MAPGVFASVDAPRIGLMMGLARIFETFERMSEEDQETAYRYLTDPTMPPPRHLHAVS
jgi:hypothetical protein